MSSVVGEGAAGILAGGRQQNKDKDHSEFGASFSRTGNTPGAGDVKDKRCVCSPFLSSDEIFPVTSTRC